MIGTASHWISAATPALVNFKLNSMMRETVAADDVDL